MTLCLNFRSGRRQHVFLGVRSLFPWKSPLENPKVSEFKLELGWVIMRGRVGAGLRCKPPASPGKSRRQLEQKVLGGWAGAVTAGLKTPIGRVLG